jgi:hypothetical protein
MVDNYMGITIYLPTKKHCRVDKEFMFYFRPKNSVFNYQVKISSLFSSIGRSLL